MSAIPCELFVPEHEPAAEAVSHRMRPYQREAVDGVFGALEHSRSTLVVSATGTGKTIVMGHLINEWTGGRVMILAHRKELIEQGQDKVHAVTGERPSIEMAERYADIVGRTKVIVSSVQTQIAGRDGKGRMSRFDPMAFGLLLVDEAHRAVSKSYRAVIAYYMQGNPNLRLVGFTATPDRGDQQALGKVFETVAYRFPVYDASEQGWLTPIKQRTVRITGLDYSKCRTTAGDLNGVDLAQVLEAEEPLHQMATPIMELAEGRQTLVFCASVQHAERFAEILNRHRDGCARFVCGETPRDERRELFAAYGRREFQILTNYGIVTEGTDLPGIEVVVLARPTKSRALFEQMIGRGLRPLPGVVDGPPTAEARLAAIAASAKPYCEVIDFAGNAGKHKLVTVSDVLGGKYDEDVRDRAAKKAAKASERGVPADVAELLKASAQEIHDAEMKKQADQRAAEERRRMIIARSSYKTSEVNPFDLYDVRPPKEVRWDGVRRPTEKQLAALERYGIDASKSSIGEAGRLLSELAGRITPKQMSVLARAGYMPSEIKPLNLQEASRLIERVAANGWRRPQVDVPAEVMA